MGLQDSLLARRDSLTGTSNGATTIGIHCTLRLPVLGSRLAGGEIVAGAGAVGPGPSWQVLVTTLLIMSRLGFPQHRPDV